MSINFHIDIEGQLSDLLKIDVAIEDSNAMQNALERIADDFRAEMKKAYKKGGTPGYRWPPNAPGYLRYDKTKRGNPPGVRTGAVRRAFTLGKGSGAVESYEGSNLEIGTSIKYANFSAAGPRRPRRGVVVNQLSQVYRRGRVQGRRVPVRDPLLQLYTINTRKIRKKLHTKWVNYIVLEILPIIEAPVSVNLSRPKRRSRRRRANRRSR